MYLPAYKEWIEMFDDDLMEIWQKEQPDLRKASMLLSALQRELKKVQTDVEVDVINIKQQLKFKDSSAERINEKAGPSSHNDEESKSPNANVKRENDRSSCKRILFKGKSDPKRPVSPDLFKQNTIEWLEANTSVVIISATDSDETNIETPPLKRRKRNFTKRKMKLRNDKSQSKESDKSLENPENTVVRKY